MSTIARRITSKSMLRHSQDSNQPTGRMHWSTLGLLATACSTMWCLSFLWLAPSLYSKMEGERRASQIGRPSERRLAPPLQEQYYSNSASSNNNKYSSRKTYYSSSNNKNENYYSGSSKSYFSNNNNVNYYGGSSNSYSSSGYNNNKKTRKYYNQYRGSYASLDDDSTYRSFTPYYYYSDKGNHIDDDSFANDNYNSKHFYYYNRHDDAANLNDDIYYGGTGHNKHVKSRNHVGNYHFKEEGSAWNLQRRYYEWKGIPYNQYTKTTNLSDVYLCLAMALGWMVWMFSSFVRSDLLRYQNESILVRGHVLQVSIEEDSLGTGIPTFHAVIDYMLERDESSIQIRKHFETQNLLEEGFANVELLVLPAEPTHSVLREDWQQLFEEQRHDDCIRIRTFCKRASIVGSGFLVLSSLALCIFVTVNLAIEERWKGWLVLCLGVTILLPSAILTHRFLQWLQRVMDSQSEKAGIILRGAHEKLNACADLDVLDPHACDEEERLVSMTAPTPRNSAVATSCSGGSLQYHPNGSHLAWTDETSGYFVKFQPTRGRRKRKAGASVSLLTDNHGSVSPLSHQSSCYQHNSNNSEQGQQPPSLATLTPTEEEDSSISTVSSLSMQDQSEHTKDKADDNSV